MSIEKGKVICNECYWRGHESKILNAPNPFDIDDTIIGCPVCKSVDSLECVCDESKCYSRVSCGTPTPDGYRNTCGNHKPKDK